MRDQEGGVQETGFRRRARLAVLVASCLLSAVAARAEEAEPAAISIPSPVGDVEYRPGRGLALGRTGLTLGGYASLTAERDEGEPGELEIDDLSGFLSFDPHPRFHLFSELEYESIARVDSEGNGSTEGARFEVERAYGDAVLARGVKLRAGKFLTPVGRWNVIHAQPLVWTTSRPLATEIPFDESTTGLELSATIFGDSGSATASLFGQATDGLEPTPQVVEQERAAGARLEIDLDGGPAIGGTYLAFRSSGRWTHLGGADLLWHREPLELHVEGVASDREGGGFEGGAFVQAALEVVPRTFAIGRYELFDPRSAGRSVHLFVVGFAYRPWPPLVLKSEILLASRSSRAADPGFKASIAWLF